MRNYLRILISIFIISFSQNHTFAQSKNEIVIGIGTTQGTIKDVKGKHDAVTNNAGTNVKLVTLTDDKFKSDAHISIDYYRNLTGNLYLNAGISTFSVKTSATQASFVGGYTIASFPGINFFGYVAEIGPSYRFDTNSSYTPFIGLNASFLSGSQDNTKFANDATYGVGGNHTHVECIGYTPKVGVFKNSGFLKGFGVTVNSSNLSCSNGAMRSFQYDGYRGDFSILRYQLDYRISF